MRIHSPRTLLGANARNAAIAASGAAAVVALTAGAVRLIPWALDPAVPWAVLVPFARGVGALALEAALLVGWPLGWALAAQRVKERGEWRALEALGVRPAAAVLALGPQAVALAVVLGLVSFAAARDAASPGRVAQELVDAGGAACADTRDLRAHAVPLVGVTWLCSPGASPRLVARPPSLGARAVVTADALALAGDLAAARFRHARVALFAAPVAAPRAGARVAPVFDVKVDELTVRGLRPWGASASTPPLVRAFAIAGAAAAAALASLVALLCARAPSRARAVASGLLAPLVALAVLRACDRGVAPLAATALAPVLAAAVAVGLARLPRRGMAASS